MTQCVPSPEDESKCTIPRSINVAFLGRVSRKNTPLNPYGDSFSATSIISRFESGLFGNATLSTKIFGISL